MRVKFDLNEGSYLLQAISHYTTNVIYLLSQPSRTQEKLVEWVKHWTDGYKGKNNFWWDEGYQKLASFDVHHVRQDWGSTSAGWGGMGGSAMTQTYTTVIYCPEMEIICVYYQGTLAYIMDVSTAQITKDWSKVPAYSSVKNNPHILYLHTRK